MTPSLRFLLLSLLLLLLLATCKKDEISTEETLLLFDTEISGRVQVDSTGDGSPNFPASDVWVYFFEEQSIMTTSQVWQYAPDSIPPGLGIWTTKTGADGRYSITGLPPHDSYFLAFLGPPHTYDAQIVDTTPDGDTAEANPDYDLYVGLEEGEHDDGNDMLALMNNSRISGVILEDVDEDGIGDQPWTDSVEIKLVARWDNGQPNIWDEVADPIQPDAEGRYEFLYLGPGEYTIALTPDPEIRFLQSGDQSPDPEGAGDPDTPNYIPVDVTQGKQDEGNRFVVRRPKPVISGYVLEDADGDDVGDNGLENHRIELYYRDAEGNPVSGPGGGEIAGVFTDATGYFVFWEPDLDIPPGEYVLSHVGTGEANNNCIDARDETQEPGEPDANPNCKYLSVNIADEDEEDAGNIFILEAQ